VTIRRDDIAGVYPLSPMQEGMLFHGLLESGGDAVIPYVMQLSFTARGRLDLAVFEESWNRLIARHDVLRSVFSDRGSERPLQVVLKERRISIDVHDARGLDPAARERFAADYCRRQRETPFDLRRDLLMRVGAIATGINRWRIVWTFHHILMDGWCMNLLQRELFVIYAALLEGLAPQLPAPVPYRDYIRRLQAVDAAASLAYWRQALEGFETPVAPLGARRGQPWGELRQHGFELDAAQTSALRAASAACHATLNNLVQAAWALLLARYNGVDDVVFGAVVAGRPHDVVGIDELVGLCINTVPFRLRIGDGDTLAALLAKARDAALGGQEHAWSSLAEVQAQSAPKRDLLNHLLVFESFPSDVRFEAPSFEPAPGLFLENFVSWMPNNYAFQLAVFPGERTRVVFTWRDGAFEDGQVERMAAHLRQLLERFAPGARVESIDVLTEEERVALTQIDVLPPSDESLAARIERLLTAAPSRPAVTAGAATLTWGELGARSAQRAAQLGADRVAICDAAGIDFVVDAVAAMRRGIPFVPIDPANPPERTRRILDDCRNAPAAPGDAYILYTSGSTGTPKGVIVGEAALRNYAGWLAADAAIGPDSRTALLSSHAFDLGYTALFGALLNGGHVFLPDEPTRRDPDAVVALCIEQRLTFLKVTPGILHLLVNAATAARLAEARALRDVFIGGEAFVPADLEAFRRLAPHATLRNHYGPTECCIGCISGVLDPRDPDVAAGVPILGTPIRGAAAFVLDARRRLVPPGVRGELWIGGRGVARGYTSGDETRFAPAPWDAALRLFRTGDLAERRPDGRFVFHGRADDQVKVRGYRVEPAEVEAALRRVAPVRDAVVAGAGGELTAFVIAASGELDVAQLRAELGALVPDYMVPSRFVAVSRFPLTANGKVDRRALAEHQPAPRRAAGGALSNEIEIAIAEVWRSVLGVDEIGPDDDFFVLGGHSVKAILTLSRISKRLGVRLQIRDVFDHPTVRALALHVARGGDAGPSDPRIVLRRGSPEAPAIFFLPALIGTSTIYKELVDALDADVNAIGLQCRGFDRDEPPFATLAEMTGELAAAIRRAQPCGPYRLCGYSMGVPLALQLASMLEAGGEEVSLILIDGLPEVSESLDIESLDDLRAQPHWRHVLAIAGESLDARTLDRIAAVARQNARLMRGFRFTGRLRADVDCIEAEESGANMHALRAVTSGRFEVRKTPGGHYTLVHPPHVRTLRQHLASIIQKGAASPHFALSHGN
jgi:amino acid adenylation domain-containing protein